jgi:KUP system potassium uptake protein
VLPRRVRVAVDAANVLGVLSLVLWSLVLVISVKYLGFVLRADNRGEGGILALVALAVPRYAPRSRLARAARAVRRVAALRRRHAHARDLGALGGRGHRGGRPALAPLVIPTTSSILIGLFCDPAPRHRAVGALFGPW